MIPNVKNPFNVIVTLIKPLSLIFRFFTNNIFKLFSKRIIRFFELTNAHTCLEFINDIQESNYTDKVNEWQSFCKLVKIIEKSFMAFEF